MSVRLFSNATEDDGTRYMDFIAHSHHMKRGKLVDEMRPKDMVAWRSSFSSIVHYPVTGWSEFTQRPTDDGIIIPTSCLYCKKSGNSGGSPTAESWHPLWREKKGFDRCGYPRWWIIGR